MSRSQQIDETVTPYYHCMSRCVRGAYLCGEDRLKGYNFEHRRQWIEERLRYLADVFALDVCAYAVMTNHYHVVLRIDRESAERWSEEEVVLRWSKLYAVAPWVGEPTADRGQRGALIGRWRERLLSISWFMRSVNEPLARWANREEGCRGRFWEGRFRSQALLDEAAVLKCMVYVDLNPIRAQMAPTPERSAHTSIKARIEGDARALAVMSESSARSAGALPISTAEYVLLVDWSGRRWRADKRGRIDPKLAPVLERLNARQTDWLAELKGLMRRYCRAIGSVASLLAYREHLGQQRLRGLRMGAS